MKTIYVTIEEFEKNGGKITEGREIFGSERGGFSYAKYVRPHGCAELCIISSGAYEGSKSKDSCFIAIECEPRYI